MEDCEAGGITPFVPKPDRSPARSSGHFTKSEFQYDAATDTYRCPAGQRLVPLYRGRAGKTRDGIWVISYVNRAACRSCDLREPMHQRHPPTARPLRERSHDGSDGGSPRGSARGDGPSSGVRRTSLRVDQAVDGPGRVPDASTRQRPRGVQPHRLGLQHGDARSISRDFPR